MWNRSCCLAGSGGRPTFWGPRSPIASLRCRRRQSPAAALKRCYNLWLADVLSGQDRIKWTAWLSLRDVPSAVAQVREAKRNGAVGVSILGTVGDRTLDAPEFLPFFEAAAEEDLTV